MLKSFDDYRDKMISIMGASAPVLSTTCPADTATLDLSRIRMARILTAYHLFAERELFGPCLSLSDPRHRERVRAVAAECAALARDFRAFTRECEINPVIHRWAEYRTTALAMMLRIRNHLSAAEIEARRCTAMRVQPPETQVRILA